MAFVPTCGLTGHERIGVAPAIVAKRAALLFDRVLAVYSPGAPAHSVPVEIGIPALALSFAGGPTEKWHNLTSRLIANEFVAEGYQATPVYDSQQGFQKEHPRGRQIAYQAALQSLPDFVEEGTSWEQIIEFRNDSESVRKYRALRLWLEQSLTADSVAQAQEVIAQKICDYEWSLKKHGLMTTTGAISTIISKESLLAATGGAGLGALLGGPVAAAISSGLVVVAKTAVWLAERLIERADIERGAGSEIAIIYDAQRELGGDG